MYMFKFLYKYSAEKWHQNIYRVLLYISYLLYFLSIIGISLLNPKKLEIVNSILTLYVCLILLFRFNPLIDYSYNKTDNKFDREIAFTAGFLLLISIAVRSTSKKIIEFSNLINDINNI